MSSTLPLNLAFVCVVGCSLIGLSTMIALCVFNFILKRPLYSMSSPLADDDDNDEKDDKQSSKEKESQQDGPDAVPEPEMSYNQQKWMKNILAFAVGSLLGDVFLHLLPESATSLETGLYNVLEAQKYLGYWIIGGVLFFLVLESFLNQLFVNDDDDNENAMSKKMTGYMNLIANAFDNFSHGMSVGASFLVSLKAGWCTTFAIIIHEIPHELADHAIMIRSGFTNFGAFKAQMSICLVTILGALSVLFGTTFFSTLWILPLTAGGFIYIALGTLLPEVFQFDEIDFDAEMKYTKRSKKFIKFLAMAQRILFILAGIFVMAAVNVLNFF